MSESDRNPGDLARSVYVRTPYYRPTPSDQHQLPVPLPLETSFIQFRHPGYLPGHDLVLRLPALDRSSSGSEMDIGVGLDRPAKWGVHHSTALDACTIVACNRPGFLSSTKIDIVPVAPPPALPLDAVLTEPSYWFYPLGWKIDDGPYPVFPDFDNWEFPTEAIPQTWLAISSGEYEGALPAPSQFSRVVNERDPACRISAFAEMTQVAHVVPKEERAWFVRNLMFQFNLNSALTQQYVTCDLSNCLRLRQDIHALFDSKSFVLVPKNGLPIIHFLAKGLDYCREFHNRTTGALAVHPAFLYARFAWAIFPLTANFSRRRDVRLSVYNEDTTAWEATTASEFARKAAAETTSTKRRRRDRDVDMDVRDGTSGPANVDEHDEQNLPLTKRLRTMSPTPAVHAKLTASFCKIVAANPAFAWSGLGWHPDLDRIELMRERALAQQEPIRHGIEVKRQLEMLERQGCLSEEE